MRARARSRTVATSLSAASARFCHSAVAVAPALLASSRTPRRVSTSPCAAGTRKVWTERSGDPGLGELVVGGGAVCGIFGVITACAALLSGVRRAVNCVRIKIESHDARNAGATMVEGRRESIACTAVIRPSINGDLDTDSHRCGTNQSN